jgi:thiol-disulfide isomerase/thioredoxin
MKTILLFTLITALFPCSAQSAGTNPPQTTIESFGEIVIRIESEKAQALEAYLSAKPEASDFQAGLKSLSVCYEIIGDESRQLATLEKLYGFIAKGAVSDLQEIQRNLYLRVKLLAHSENMKDLGKAKAVIVQARKDLSQHADVEGTKDLLEMLEGMIHQPVIGGTLEMAFTALDGTKVDPAAMRGKVVLVDFWATWCGPCVAELPNVKAAYDKFHDKGFEVIGISLDDATDKAKLEAFIKKKNLPWPQSFSGKGWNEPFAIKYGITSIPATFLIGKDGKIAGIGVGGHELENKVAELLQ